MTATDALWIALPLLILGPALAWSIWLDNPHDDDGDDR